jgi:hypothetical protein
VLAQRGAARQASGRGLVLLPVGALAVHQLRYSFAYGSQASTELADQGHAYLSSLVPWIMVLVAAGLGSYLARLARAWQLGPDGPATRSFARTWSTTALSLIAIYSAQELLEGFFADGHPPGLVGVFGNGGWWSIPTATLVGLGIAALLRVGCSLVRLAARARRAVRASLVVVSAARGCSVWLQHARPPLADAAAGRAPPRYAAG